ncbi:type II secretion system GspH family protein [Lyngbya sp. CCAP 1446/10]|uniref:type II secretion system GspH family protein n=1 Tax=Lyngbya sp. CCAP 1446/10 TaxID=439293 RepID=UPI002238B5A5|nr:type II secretion system GspH family protein [Lyngbya sp. CCAP 1446/10]MCW6052138.1 type II secretion system GspH family protein [Lyngbya sp. CCAP 1446/10]
MNKLLTDNTYSQPALLNGAKAETKFSDHQAETKSGICAQKAQSRDGGYTIIESLVAMIVVSVLMIAIAPVMAFSVATRVQARRVELATQAAKSYIDALRTGTIRPSGSTPASQPGFPTNAAVAPTSSAALYCFNLDETPGCADSSKKDFYVQGILPSATTTDTGYSLTVRVYRADGFSSGKSMEIKQQSVANSALGNPQAPLVVMQTEIPPTTQGGSSAYRSLCDRTIGCK